VAPDPPAIGGRPAAHSSRFQRRSAANTAMSVAGSGRRFGARR
jgi:hypothetical protein